MVELNKSPVLRKAFLAGANGNRRGSEDISQHTQVLCTPMFRHVTVEFVDGPNRLLHLRQTILIRLPLISYTSILALNGVPQDCKLPLVLLNPNKFSPDLCRHGLEGVLICFCTEEDDIVTRLAGQLGAVELIKVFACWEHYMAGRKEEDLIALVEVETTGAFEVRVVSGGDPKAK